MLVLVLRSDAEPLRKRPPLESFRSLQSFEIMTSVDLTTAVARSPAFGFTRSADACDPRYDFDVPDAQERLGHDRAEFHRRDCTLELIALSIVVSHIGRASF